MSALPATTHDLLVWFAVTLLLGAPAAVASGRALAQSWQGFGRCFIFAVLLAAVADFLCYALFQVPILPLYELAGTIVAGDFFATLSLLSGLILTALVLLAFAFTGWRRTRAKQMRSHYPFL